MRPLLTLAFACAFVALLPAAGLAAYPASLDITAQQVNFYSNRFVLTADGDVRVRLSDGTVVSGQTFSMDLKLNRYLVAGDVHVDGPTIHQAGAAFAGYPDLDRSFFLPEAAEPERWTYFGTNWSDPHPGREQPGDAYNFPNLTGERSYIMASGARVIPRTNVRFDDARIYTAGVYLPSPRYVVTFSANSHYYENAFPGGRFDVALPFNGSEHSLTALHLRNDVLNGSYLAIDQHFVWPQDWIAASIVPLTQEQRQYNLIGYKRFSPKVEGRVFFQEQAAQPGILNRPINAAAFGEIQLNAGLRRSGLSYTQDNYAQYLLGFAPQANDAVFGPNYDPRWREHPMQALLAWTGYENFVTKSLPLRFRLRSGLGYAHDVYGEGGYPNEQPGPATTSYRYAGGTLYTTAIRVARDTSLSAQYDRQRTWFSLPHQEDVTDTRASLARAFAALHLNTYVAYEVRNIADYWGAQQLAAYPANPEVVTTEFGTYSGQSAFRGFATQRALSAAGVYSPTPYFTFSATMTRNYDWPAPVPGFYGQPPVIFTGDLRMRLSRQLMVDLYRQYYFNFANERWMPQFGLQFSP